MSCFVSEVFSSRNIPTGTDGLDRRRRLGIDRTQKEIKPISRNIILPSSVPADTDGWRAFSGKKIEAKRTNVTVWRPLSLGRKDVFSLIFHPTDGSSRSGWMDGLAGCGVWVEHKKTPQHSFIVVCACIFPHFSPRNRARDRERRKNDGTHPASSIVQRKVARVPSYRAVGWWNFQILEFQFSIPPASPRRAGRILRLFYTQRSRGQRSTMLPKRGAGKWQSAKRSARNESKRSERNSKRVRMWKRKYSKGRAHRRGERAADTKGGWYSG